MFRNQCLHDAPCRQICDCTVAEDDHIAGRLAAEAHEGEGLTLSGSVIKEHSRALVDEEGGDTSCHVSYTCDRRDGRLREHIAHSREDIRRP